MSPDRPSPSQQVDQFIESLDHPMKSELLELRAIFLAADPRVTEGIKWKSLSFFYVDWFATFNLRSTDKVQIILHTGAKVKAGATEGVPVDDSEVLLKWLAKDRAMLTLTDMADIRAKREAVGALVRQWVELM